MKGRALAHSFAMGAAQVTPKITKRAFFDVSIGGKATGRTLFEELR